MRSLVLILFIFLIGCKSNYNQKISSPVQPKLQSSDFIIAFGSCDDQKLENPFWQQLTELKPDVWIWNGDNIYCDTEDVTVLKNCYQIKEDDINYQNFIKNTSLLGTWDDHDYGMNDGGKNHPIKKEAQQLLQDFLKVDKDDIRRTREGVYYSKSFNINSEEVKIILLDTRYFRSNLTSDKTGKKRYLTNQYGDGTMLGEAQWKWLEKELFNSKARFNIIVSSIQFLSNKHGFECWGTMPHEADKLEDLIVRSKAKGVFIISGDRHISEISQKNIGKGIYPLIDFTSSGLTHSYKGYKGEENPYRISNVIFEKSYGVIRLNLESFIVIMEMYGVNNNILDRKMFFLNN
ncbi:MAG: alkaline phosphatase family protein [Flavobacteriaceae bacterium]|nr:alkaline phosphatase family protein [Flavobacteriaceae bacterium]